MSPPSARLLRRLLLLLAVLGWLVGVPISEVAGASSFNGCPTACVYDQSQRGYDHGAILQHGALSGACGSRGRKERSKLAQERTAPKCVILATKAGPRRTDFIADERGTVVPTSQSRTRQGLEDAGFPSHATQAPGRQYRFPDGSTVRLMEPSGQAGRRAAFENPFGGPIRPFTGRPVHAPRNLPPGARRDYVRSRTHVEQGP